MATVPGRPSPPKPPKREGDRAKEDALLQKASSIRAVWKTLATAFSPQPEEPPRTKAHWDFVLQEGAWMAHDVMQERMWKHAAAFALAHAAAAFDKRALKPTKTRVCASVERATNEFGRVKQDGKPLFPPSVANSKPAAPEVPAKAEQPLLSPLFFTCADGLADALTEVLEEEDVMRLACHVEAQLAYQATVVAARRAQPMPAFADEDLQLNKKRRKVKPSTVGMPGTEDEYEGGGVGPMVGARAPQRRTAGAMAPARGSLADMGDEVTAPSGRDRRKRKPRDVFGDDEFEVPSRPPEAAPRPRGSRQGGPDNRRSNKAANLDARRNKASLQPMQGARVGSMPGAHALPPGHAGATAAGMMPRPGPWNPQDDQLLVAIVTEFSQNWHLVADVLRSASSMSGVFRRWDACKTRYSMLLKLQVEAEQAQHPDPNHPVQSPVLMSKTQAKEVVNASLPVPENVLRAHQVMVLNLAARLKQRKTTERQQTALNHRVHVTEHPTHLKVQQAVLEACGGCFGTPVEIGTVADPTAQAAAVLQQQQQQQQAAAAAAALQQQQAAAAAAQAQAAAAVSAAPFAAASSPAPAASLALPPAAAATGAADPLAAAQAQQAAATAAATAAAASQPGAAALPGAAFGGLPIGPTAGLQPTAAGPRASASTTPEPPPGLAAAMGGSGAMAAQQQAHVKGAGMGAAGGQDEMMGAAHATPLPQLQAQAQAAKAAAAANPTQEMKAHAQMAATMLAAAQAQPRNPLPSPSTAQAQAHAAQQVQAAQQAGANSNSAAAAIAAATAAALPGMAGMGAGMQGMQGMPGAGAAAPGMGTAGSMPPQQGLPGVPDAAAAAAASVSGAFPVGLVGGTPQQQQQQQAMQAQLATMQAQFAQAQAAQQPGGKQGAGGMSSQQMQQLALKQQQQGMLGGMPPGQQGMGNGGTSRGPPGMAGLAGGPAAAAAAAHGGGMPGLPPGSMAQPSSSTPQLTPQQLQLQMQLQQAWQGMPGMQNMPGMQQLPPFSMPQFGAPQPRPPI